MKQAERTGIAVRIMMRASRCMGWQTKLQELDGPPRSKLYGMEPMNGGTVWSECLTSYINRLGWRHGVSPRTLAAQEIGPLLVDAEWWRYPSPQLMGIFCAANAMSINGSGNLATTWSTLLEQLTSRADLHLLTTPWWIGDLPMARNLRTFPAWCPACYAQWKQQGLPLYQPLLWMLQVVTICPTHNRRLVEQCPSCQGKQAVIVSHKAQSGECTKCAGWLGAGEYPSLEQPLDDEQVNWQAWVVSVLKELRIISLSSEMFSWKTFFASLASVMERQKGYSQLARLTGIDRRSLYQWVWGKVTPSLELILKFCYVCGTTPMQIMTNQWTSLEQAIQADPASRPSPHERSSWQRVDVERCRNFIQAILDGREQVLSVRQATLRLKCPGRFLQSHFPQQCEQMTQQYREYRRRQREKYLEGVCEEVRSATVTLHTQGISPTRRRVAALLKDPERMRMPEARKTWQVVRQELALRPSGANDE
jgi:DNA-binding phage protein